jgi:membrane protease YdiL (CAAX protease family)
MPALVDHILFVIIAVGLPITSFVNMRFRLGRLPLPDLPAARMRAYQGVIVTQWVLVAAVLISWWVRRRAPGELGLTASAGWLSLAAGVFVVAAVVLLVTQGRSLIDAPEYHERVRKRLLGIWRLLPASREQWRLFIAVSITAGVCEEILFRGFAIRYLSTWFSVPVAAVIASLAFGLGHTYQGPRGILITAALGGLLAAIYLLGGTLWPAMLLHAAIDANAGWIAWRLAERLGPYWVVEPPLPVEPGQNGPTTEGAAGPPEPVAEPRTLME